MAPEEASRNATPPSPTFTFPLPCWSYAPAPTIRFRSSGLSKDLLPRSCTSHRSHGTSHACHITPFAIAWITNCPNSWCPAQQLCFLVVVVGSLLYAALNTDTRMTRSTADRCVVVMVLQKALKRPHFCLSNRTAGFAISHLSFLRPLTSLTPLACFSGFRSSSSLASFSLIRDPLHKTPPNSFTFQKPLPAASI